MNIVIPEAAPFFLLNGIVIAMVVFMLYIGIRDYRSGNKSGAWILWIGAILLFLVILFGDLAATGLLTVSIE